MAKVKKAIIPAAGLGTRFLPATKAVPKEMLPIVDKPTLQYIIEELVDAGIEEILIVTGRTKRSVEDHFDVSFELEAELEQGGKTELLEICKGINNLAKISYVRQGKALGLGHAIGCGESFAKDEPFAVILGDEIVYTKPNEKNAIRQLIDAYEETDKTIIGVRNVPLEDTNKYGIVETGESENGLIKAKSLVEKPKPEDAPSTLAILGRYVITPDIFPLLRNGKQGVGGEIQLTDSLSELAKTQGLYACEFKGERYDVGDKLGYMQANVEYALRDEKLGKKFKEYLKTLEL
ncbi:UTP--glucose-1-phosphate uridylyltransferase GalU [Treponema sp. R6D11]